MRSRILSIVLALSLIAVLFAAIPTRAAVDYTGTVTTTDPSGTATTNFLQGEHVLVKVEVMMHGVPSNQTITVTLERTNDGYQVDSLFNVNTVFGWYNSTAVAGYLTTDTTFFGSPGDVQSCYVIVTLGGTEIARSEIVVRAVGLTLTPAPNSPAYWPGEIITMTLVVNEQQTGLVFYVQVVNATMVTEFNITGQDATSGYWTKTFTINATWPDGGYDVNVREYQGANPDRILYSRPFAVQEFYLQVFAQRYNYLPGETANITYIVSDLATFSPITSGVNVYYSVSYRNSTGNLTFQNNTLEISQNLWAFTLPTNGTSHLSIALYSNVNINITAEKAAGERNITDHLTFVIGSIDASVNLNSGSFLPGDTVVVTVNADVLGASLDGATVGVTVARNGTLLVPGYGATNLTTDQSGTASYLFQLPTSAARGNYIVTATVSKVGYSAVRQNQFSVNVVPNLIVALDQKYYYGGQVATAYFEPILNSMPTGGNVSYKFMMGSLVLSIGSTTAGSATATIPANAYGTIAVNATAYINGVMESHQRTAPVYFASLGLTAEKSNYKPGDTVVFQWSIITGQTTADLAYEILDSNGVRVANGTPTFAMTGSFEFTVPDAGPLLSQSYQATLRMTTPEGGFASASTSVGIVSQMVLSISVGKSSYTSGEFAPGEKITIHYDLSSYVKTAPSSIRLVLTVNYDPSTYSFVVNSPTGTISYTILKDAPVTLTGLQVTAYDAATGQSLASDQSTFWVNNQVSGWDTSIGGVSAIDLVILVLLIIVILMLIVVPYMKDRMARPKPPEAAKPMELTPPPPSEPGKAPPSP